jgi:hypothetical protein
MKIAIVLSRSLPYSVPEAMVFLARLAGMPTGKFVAALIVGGVPTAFVFAALGAGCDLARNSGSSLGVAGQGRLRRSTVSLLRRDLMAAAVLDGSAK